MKLTIINVGLGLGQRAHATGYVNVSAECPGVQSLINIKLGGHFWLAEDVQLLEAKEANASPGSTHSLGGAGGRGGKLTGLKMITENL